MSLPVNFDFEPVNKVFIKLTTYQNHSQSSNRNISIVFPKSVQARIKRDETSKFTNFSTPQISSIVLETYKAWNVAIITYTNKEVYVVKIEIEHKFKELNICWNWSCLEFNWSGIGILSVIWSWHASHAFSTQLSKILQMSFN